MRCYGSYKKQVSNSVAPRQRSDVWSANRAPGEAEVTGPFDRFRTHVRLNAADTLYNTSFREGSVVEEG
jgi:hypothetical protein